MSCGRATLPICCNSWLGSARHGSGSDLGSGGGFPGIPIACALAGQPGAKVHLIESNGKKAAFLRDGGEGDRGAGGRSSRANRRNLGKAVQKPCTS